MPRQSGRIVAAKVIIGLFLIAAAWTVMASVVFLYGTGLARSFAHPFYQWWLYLLYAPPNPIVSHWLKIGAGVATALSLVFCVVFAVRLRRIGPSLRKGAFAEPLEPMRGTTDNHGHADWLSMSRAQEIFSGPCPDYGGIVVGEAYRVDQDRVAHRMFDPHNKATWGKGGKCPLLIDPCKFGPTHSLVFAGAGSFKSTSAVSTLLTWTGSAVVLDPSCELGPMLAQARTDMGHTVHQLTLRDEVGFNVLDWIDIDSPLATTNVLSVVSWVCGDGPIGGAGGDKNNEFFAARGRSVVACLLAHMMWDSTIPFASKTLGRLRRGLATPEKEMKKLLRSIHQNSESPLARDYAGTLMGLVEETFSGVYAHADESTAWLANPAYAAAVSGDTFTTSDLLRGTTSIFLQIPLGALQTTPAIGRVLVGALLNAAYEADGGVRGRILYLLDEAARLGPMKIIETARDAGRKYGITLQLLYQSVGQLERQWGREGKREWYECVSYRLYAAIQDSDTAKELEETFGTYGVMATSEGMNSGSAGKPFEPGSRSRGANTSYHEMARPLIRHEELMNDCRTDEAFVVIRSARPLRCGRAIYFRRPELAKKVAANRFSQQATAAE